MMESLRGSRVLRRGAFVLVLAGGGLGAFACDGGNENTGTTSPGGDGGKAGSASTGGKAGSSAGGATAGGGKAGTGGGTAGTGGGGSAGTGGGSAGTSGGTAGTGGGGAGTGGGTAGTGGGSAGTGGTAGAGGGTAGTGGGTAGAGGSQAMGVACDGPPKPLLKPEPILSLVDSFQEGWLASPAVADLDVDGKNEIIAARGGRIVVWGADGKKRWHFEATGRIWASPVVADLTAAPGLEIAFAARDKIYVLDHEGKVQPGFPVTWKDELRSIAAGDVDGDGKLDLVVALAKGGGQPDIVAAYRTDGTKVAGFPPNEAKASGCDDKCYRAGCYDQNLAVGDVDGDGKADVFAPHDNAYASFHKGTGEAFDANAAYPKVKKTPGVRYLHKLSEAAQGYAEEEETALQAHFTNTAPALADLDGDGKLDVVMLGSVQNASQTKREQGVGLWAVRPDASRLAGFESPIHYPLYMAGLWDFEGTNIVGATNQVSVADITKASAGPEIVFAGFDGMVHAVAANGQKLWDHTFTSTKNLLVPGVALGDIDGDGEAEIVYGDYSTEQNMTGIAILDACGRTRGFYTLPGRGSMAVPTLADVDGDGTVDIVVSLKDSENGAPGVLVHRVPGSKTNYLPWPTGRGNLRRSGSATQ